MIIEELIMLLIVHDCRRTAFHGISSKHAITGNNRDRLSFQDGLLRRKDSAFAAVGHCWSGAFQELNSIVHSRLFGCCSSL